MQEQQSLTFSRRGLLRFLALTPLAYGVPLFAQGRPSTEQMLRHNLDDIPLSHSSARLSLTQFDERGQNGDTEISAVVRLDWSPGQRLRPFSGRGKTPDEAVEAVTNAVTEQFSNLA